MIASNYSPTIDIHAVSTNANGRDEVAAPTHPGNCPATTASNATGKHTQKLRRQRSKPCCTTALAAVSANERFVVEGVAAVIGSGLYQSAARGRLQT